MVKEFLNTPDSARRTKRTCKKYSHDITKFTNYLTEIHFCGYTEVPYSYITEKVVQNYIDFLRLNGMKDGSINSHVRTLRSFFNFLVEQKVLKQNPITNHTFLPIFSKEIITTPTKDIETMVKWMRQQETYKWTRAATIMTLLFDTGINARDVAKILYKDVIEITKPGKRIIKINGKDVVPLQRTRKILSAFIELRKSCRGSETNPYLFASPRVQKSIDMGAVLKDFKKAAEVCGVKSKVGLTNIAHSFHKRSLDRRQKCSLKDSYCTSKAKDNNRENIIQLMNDKDERALILESPKLSALREMVRQGKIPKVVHIPNDREGEKVSRALVKSDIPFKDRISIYDKSALEFIKESDEQYTFVWLDYTGTFGKHEEDVAELVKKLEGPLKLIMTFNTREKGTTDVKLMKIALWVAQHAERTPKVIEEISGQYKANMYTIGLTLEGRNE